jgi:hypothetical protein
MDKTKIYIYGLVGITLLVVLAGVLAFFNIIPLKSATSGVNNANTNSDVGDVNNSSSTDSSNKVKSNEELSAERRIYTFIGEAMELAYKPAVRPTLVKGPVTYAAGNLNPYHGSYIAVGQKVEVVDFGTMIAIMLNNYTATFASLDQDNIYKLLDSYFIFPSTVSKQSMKERETLRGMTVASGNFSA